MKVRDFMITRVFTVKPTNTVEELLNILNTNIFRKILIVPFNFIHNYIKTRCNYLGISFH